MYSGIAYSSAKNISICEDWYNNCDKGLIRPDLIFYLDTCNLTKEKFIQRFYNSLKERYDGKSDFLNLVNNNFKKLFKPLHFVCTLPAGEAINTLHTQILDSTTSKLKNFSDDDDNNLKYF
jgi:thymidylate kinase